MNELSYKFLKEDKPLWRQKLKQAFEIISNLVDDERGDLELILKPFKRKKSVEQLRGVYKLFQKALPHFQDWKPNFSWDVESIKEFIKAELGYTREPSGFEISMMIKNSGFSPKDKQEKKRMIEFCRKIKQNRSFADFTMEELYSFTKEFEVWAATEKDDKPSWQDVLLDEKESLLK